VQRAATFRRDSIGRQYSVCAPSSEELQLCDHGVREHNRHSSLDGIPYLPLGATSSYPEPAVERWERPPQLLMMNRALRFMTHQSSAYARTPEPSYYREFAMPSTVIACAHTASTRFILHHVGRERVPRPLCGLI